MSRIEFTTKIHEKIIRKLNLYIKHFLSASVFSLFVSGSISLLPLHVISNAKFNAFLVPRHCFIVQIEILYNNIFFQPKELKTMIIIQKVSCAPFIIPFGIFIFISKRQAHDESQNLPFLPLLNSIMIIIILLFPFWNYSTAAAALVKQFIFV